MLRKVCTTLASVTFSVATKSTHGIGDENVFDVGKDNLDGFFVQHGDERGVEVLRRIVSKLSPQ